MSTCLVSKRNHSQTIPANHGRPWIFVQVAAALQQLQLNTLCTAPADQDGSPAALSSLDTADPAMFVGASGSALGVSAANLLEEALPPEGQRQRALAAALPALEAALRRRCADVAAASGYGSSSDFSGLPDHISQLQEAALQQRAQQVGAASRAGAAEIEWAPDFEPCTWPCQHACGASTSPCSRWAS